MVGIVISLIFIVSGCDRGKYVPSGISFTPGENISYLHLGNTTVNIRFYNGTLFYCFINDTDYHNFCVPYDDEIVKDIIEDRNKTNYEVCRIIDEVVQYCYDDMR